jgi:hypothetical protein
VLGFTSPVGRIARRVDIMTESIAYQGCSASVEIVARVLDDDGTEKTEPATEWDMWRAGYVSVARIEDLLECAAESEESCTRDEAHAVQDFIAEGPPLPPISSVQAKEIP